MEPETPSRLISADPVHRACEEDGELELVEFLPGATTDFDPASHRVSGQFGELVVAGPAAARRQLAEAVQASGVRLAVPPIDWPGASRFVFTGEFRHPSQPGIEADLAEFVEAIRARRSFATGCCGELEGENQG